MENRNLPSAIVIGIVGFVLLTLFGSSMFLTIDPGEKGVLFKRFGGGLDKETIYGQGFHVIAPWNDMHVYNVKIQENYEAMEVLSKNGLSIKIDLSFRYNANDSQIGHLHDNIGKSYVNSIVKPEIRSVTREVIGNYLPEELYSTKREAIEDEIYTFSKMRTKKTLHNVKAYHTSSTVVGKVAKITRCKKLVLTHFVPTQFNEKKLIDVVTKDFGKKPIIGKDLLKITI